MNQLIKPNIPDPVNTANDNPAVPTLGSIAEKMAVMREQTLRNQIRATEDTATGIVEERQNPLSLWHLKCQKMMPQLSQYCLMALRRNKPRMNL